MGERRACLREKLFLGDIMKRAFVLFAWPRRKSAHCARLVGEVKAGWMLIWGSWGSSLDPLGGGDGWRKQTDDMEPKPLEMNSASIGCRHPAAKSSGSTFHGGGDLSSGKLVSTADVRRANSLSIRAFGAAVLAEAFGAAAAAGVGAEGAGAGGSACSGSAGAGGALALHWASSAVTNPLP